MKKQYSILVVPFLAAFLAASVLFAQRTFSDTYPGTTCYARLTGRTTNHIITLTISNPAGEEINTEIGPLAIPSDGTFQGYVINESYPVTIPAYGSVDVPMQGYCTDHSKPAAPDGFVRFDQGGWVAVETPGAVPGPGDALTSMGYESNTETEESVVVLTYPGTNVPFTYRVDYEEYILTTGSTLVEVVNLIEEAYDEWVETEETTTTTVIETSERRSAIVQYVFWYYTSVLRGEAMTRESFIEMIVEETEVVVNTSSVHYARTAVSRVVEEAQLIWEMVWTIGKKAGIFYDSTLEQGSWSMHYQRWIQAALDEADPNDRQCGAQLILLGDTLEQISGYLGERYATRIRNGIAVKMGDYCKFELASLNSIQDLDAWLRLEELTHSNAFRFMEPATRAVIRRELDKKINNWIKEELTSIDSENTQAWVVFSAVIAMEPVSASLEPATQEEAKAAIKAGLGAKFTAFLNEQLDQCDPADTSMLGRWRQVEILTYSDLFSEYVTESAQEEIIRKLGEKFTRFLITRLDELDPADTSMLKEWHMIEVLEHSDLFSTYVSEANQKIIRKKLSEKFTSFMKTQAEKLNPADEGMLKQWTKLEVLIHSDWFTTYVSEADREEIIRILKKKFTEFVKKRLEELDPKDPNFFKKWLQLHNLTLTDWFDEYMKGEKKAEKEMSNQYRKWEGASTQPVEYSQINWQEVEWTGERTKTFFGGTIPAATERHGLRPWTWAVIAGVPVTGGIIYWATRPAPPEAAPDALTINCPGEGTISVLANDKGKDIRITGIQQPAHAVVTDQGFGKLLVALSLAEPVSQFSFSYTIEDGKGRESSAQVSVQVVLPAISLAGDEYDLVTGSPIAANVLANDTGAGLSVIENTSPEGGTFSISANGAFTYVPFPDFCEATSFTYTAQDACVQTATAQVSLNLIDNKPPQITCPPDFTISCGIPPEPAVTGFPVVSDNCAEPAELTVVYEDQFVGTGCVQNIQRTWTVTDLAGLSATCQQMIIREDVTAPVIVCPPDITVPCGQEFSTAFTGMATAFDECGGFVAIVFQDELSGLSGCEGVISRTWSATDPCGNTSFCIQMITVVPSDCPFEPLATVTPSPCGQPAGQITLDVFPPGEYSFLWSTGITGPVATGLFPGIYQVTINDPLGACTEILTVVVPEIPSFDLLVLSIIQPSFPGASDGVITLQVAGNALFPLQVFVNGGLYEVVFTPEFSLLGLTAGVYEIAVVDAMGCASWPLVVVLESMPGFNPIVLATNDFSPDEAWDQSPAPFIPEHPELLPGETLPGLMIPPLGFGLEYPLGGGFDLRWQMVWSGGRTGRFWNDPGSGTSYLLETSYRSMTQELGMRYWPVSKKMAPFFGLGLEWNKLSFFNSAVNGQTRIELDGVNRLEAFLAGGMRWRLGKAGYVELEGRLGQNPRCAIRFMGATGAIGPPLRP
jgi:hypothetical protein